MLKALLKRYNHHRRKIFFQSPLFQARQSYAFVGVGIHSLTNFYPFLRYFNIQLRYICTKTSDWQQQLSPLFPGCSFTHELQTIIDDPDIAGVFVCTTPEAHFDILRRLLQAGKPVFIEKPPCQTLAQLHELHAINPGGSCHIGLQRRHWPGNAVVRKKSRQATSYLYQFLTGPYPQGNPFTELFIHPLDYSTFLFGAPMLQSVSRHKDDKGISVQLHLTHPGNISGLLHLSTQYTWNPPLECLTIHNSSETLSVQYPTSVTGKQMPFRIANIPSERLMRQPAITKEYFSGSPTIVPAAETNSFLTQGFLPEIERFIAHVENPAQAHPGETNDLASLIPVYELMEKLA